MKKNPDSRFLRSLNDRNEFTLTFELVPSRGARGKELSKTMAFARDIALDGRLQAVSITENAGGHPALSPEVLGVEIQAMNLDVISHFSCKDKNRNQMESLLYAWDRIGLRNLLVIGGDYPQKGYRGHPKPVFDLDTIHVLDLLRCMNQGVNDGDDCHYFSPVNSTSFCKGVAVSPFKRLESEQMMQYFKLERKIAGGADYVITQVGYDSRKFHELLLYMRQMGLNVPVLGNVFIPNLAVTGFMYRGEVPGCIIPPSLYRRIMDEAKAVDKGKKARLMRAARLLCVLRGLGYDGAHIGGPGLVFEDLDFVLNQAERLAGGWRDFVSELSFRQDNSFFYYREDEKTGLNLEERAPRADNYHVPALSYAVSRFFHGLIFEPGGPLYNQAKKSCRRLAGGRLENFLSVFEHLVKGPAFGCRNCGDCTLAELAFLCPQSGCAKYLLNGPCGGSRDGWCEVYPGRKRCFYVKVYERLKSRGLEEKMKSGFVAPRDWSLNNTSSWINFFLDRDHTGRKK